jgi:hypothetical protein
MAELTKEQILLRQELNKLSKRANQRILEIERLTKRKSPQFAVKELADLLSTTKGLTKRKGKSIRASQYKKSMTETDIIGSIKALRNFLDKQRTPTSTIRGIKAYTKKISEETGKKVTYAMASKLFQAQKQWTWIFEYVNESDFWNYYNLVFKPQKPTYLQFIEDLEGGLWNGDIPIDEDLREDLKAVYTYLRA